MFEELSSGHFVAEVIAALKMSLAIDNSLDSEGIYRTNSVKNTIFLCYCHAYNFLIFLSSENACISNFFS